MIRMICPSQPNQIFFPACTAAFRSASPQRGSRDEPTVRWHSFPISKRRWLASGHQHWRVGCYSLPAAQRQSLAQITTQDVPSSALVQGGSAADPHARGQTRISLFEKTKLSDDQRANA